MCRRLVREVDTVLRDIGARYSLFLLDGGDEPLHLLSDVLLVHRSAMEGRVRHQGAQ
jgi:hypothetical protein